MDTVQYKPMSVGSQDNTALLDVVSNGGIHNLRHDTSDIRRDVCKEGGDARQEFTREILENRHVLDKSITVGQYENRLATERAIREIENNARHNTDRILDRIDNKFDKAMSAVEDNSRSLLKLELGLL